METKEQAKQQATAQALAKLKDILENNENLAKLVNDIGTETGKA
jgi:hypothetical protein